MLLKRRDFLLGSAAVSIGLQCKLAAAAQPGIAMPLMPPSYQDWTDRNEAYGYLGNMRVAFNAATGTQIGRVLSLNHSTSIPRYGFSGEISGLEIDVVTGMIAISDNSFLARGKRVITVTATNALGSQSTTLEVAFVDVEKNVWYYDGIDGDDANPGNLPHKAFRSLDNMAGQPGTKYFRRGSVWNEHGIVMTQSSRHFAYGDPAADQPWIDSPKINGAEPYPRKKSYATDLSEIYLQDLHISALERPLYFNGDGRSAAEKSLTVIRCSFSGNTPGKNRAGCYIRNLSFGGLVFRHNVIKDGVQGDGVYAVKIGREDGQSLCEFRYNTFGMPAGRVADNLQITSERKPGQSSYDVWVSDNVFRNPSGSDSTKGNLVIEGVTRYLVENNECDGRYFCISSIGNYGTVRNNHLKNANLNKNSFGLGTGEADNYGNQRWFGNIVENSVNAFSLSGYRDPEGGWQRRDFEILFNTARENTNFYKQDRPVSGYFKYNIGQLNANNTIKSTGSGLRIAMGGDYKTYETTPNYLGQAAGPTLAVPHVAGRISVGQTVSLPAGYDGYFWLINDQIISADGSREFRIPSGNADNANVPAALKAARLSAVVIRTDASGNASSASALFADGSKTSIIAQE